jgi:hypothetical protein
MTMPISCQQLPARPVVLSRAMSGVVTQKYLESRDGPTPCCPRNVNVHKFGHLNQFVTEPVPARQDKSRG